MQRPVEDFAKSGNGKRNSTCKDCVNAESKKRRTENNRKSQEYKQAKGCIDCGEKDPIVLEYDHVRGEKRFNIGASICKYSWTTIKAEIDKCEVRCANCHRRKTYERRKRKELEE